MSDTALDPKSDTATKPRRSVRTGKTELVVKLLSRPKGAARQELMEATGWQAHSVRAFLSGLRKSGHSITRESRKDGEHAYRIVAASAKAAQAVTEA